MMNIELYLHTNYDKSALKILKLLDTNSIDFSVQTFNEEDIDKVSLVIGERVRRLPFVMIDGERVGGYYDLFEYLVNKNIINYEGNSWTKYIRWPRSVRPRSNHHIRTYMKMLRTYQKITLLV